MVQESIDSRIRDRLVPFVVVAEAISLVGSSVSDRVSVPEDTDILIRWYGPAASLPEAIKHKFTSDKPVQFITEPCGPHSSYIPLFHFYMLPNTWGNRIAENLDAPEESFTVLEDYLSYKVVDKRIIFYAAPELPEIAPMLKLRKLFPDVDIEVVTEKDDDDFLPLASLIAWPIRDRVVHHIPEPHYEPFAAHKRLVLSEHDPIDLNLLNGKKLDLGCGDDKPEGWIGLDIKEGTGVDMVWDAEQPLPFVDSEFSVIRAHHFLEHISDQEHILREIHRILKPGGTFIFEVPSTRGEGAFSHPDHKSFFNIYTWVFWTQDRYLEDRPKFEVEVLDEFSDDSKRLWYVQGVLKKPKGDSIRESYVDISEGKSLATFLNNQIDSKRGDDTKASYISKIARGAGISDSTVSQILQGSIVCPPLERLRGFSKALGISLSSIVQAAEKDDCKYNLDESDSLAEARNDSGVMLAVAIPESIGKRIAVDGGEPLDKLHITLFYFGDSSEWLESDVDDIYRLVTSEVEDGRPISISIAGTDTFPNDERPFHAIVKSPKLMTLRGVLADKLDARGFTYSKDLDYTPHITLKYLKDDETEPDHPIAIQFEVNKLILTYMGSSRVIHLVEEPLSESHSRDKCMHCSNPPEVEVIWADGRAGAWFCQKHLEDFKRRNHVEVVSQRRVSGSVGNKYGLSEAIAPFSSFTAPKPRVSRFTENFTIDQLWNDWASKRISNGDALVAEPKYNGFRSLVEKKGDAVRVIFEKTNITSKLDSIVSTIKKLPGDFILDGDIGIIRKGQRLPRISLMTLLSATPKIRKGDIIVFTAFDMPYMNESLVETPFSERRNKLENFYSTNHLKEYKDFDISNQMLVKSKADLQQAHNRFGKQQGSEGLVVKVLGSNYPEGGTDEWSKLKNAVEIKATVLSVTRNKNGTYGFRAGVFPGRSKFENTTEFRGKRYIDFGKSFNSSFKADEGDIVTFGVEEIILGTSRGEPALQWLGARPIDIDRERRDPYFANQVVALAKRGNVLQEGALAESGIAMASLGMNILLAYGETLISIGDHRIDTADLCIVRGGEEVHETK